MVEIVPNWHLDMSVQLLFSTSVHRTSDTTLCFVIKINYDKIQICFDINTFKAYMLVIYEEQLTRHSI